MKSINKKNNHKVIFDGTIFLRGQKYADHPRSEG